MLSLFRKKMYLTLDEMQHDLDDGRGTTTFIVRTVEDIASVNTNGNFYEIYYLSETEVNRATCAGGIKY
jgi:hypothetical protein